MGLPLQPVVGPAALPAPSPGAGTAIQNLVANAPTSLRALATSGGTAAPGSPEQNNAKSNSTTQDNQGGARTALARQALDLPEFPAPPVSDLKIPVALIDLPRLGSSSSSPAPEPVEPAEETPDEPEKTDGKSPETALASQHRVQDESLSGDLTPPAEKRIADDIAQVRRYEAPSTEPSVDVAR